MNEELSYNTETVARLLFALATVGFLLLKVTAILAIASIAERATKRHSSAAQRHFLWSVAIGSVLMLTVLTTVVPPLDVPVRTNSLVASILRELPAERPSDTPSNSGLRSGSYPTETVIPAPHLKKSANPPRTFRAIRVEGGALPKAPVEVSVSFLNNFLQAIVWLYRVWLLGALFLLLRLGNAHRKLARIVTRARVSVDPAVLDCAQQISARLNLRRMPRVLIHPTVDTPCTAGWLRPVVLLPESSNEWRNNRLHAVLLHEFAHVSRNDYLTQLMASVTCAVYWFHPAVWIARRKLRNDCEHAADDCAIARIPTDQYAKHLLALASQSSHALSIPTVALGMARASQLEWRIRAMLNTGTSRVVISQRIRRISSMSALLVLVPISALRMSGGVETMSSPGEYVERFDGGPLANTIGPQLSRRAPITTATSDSIIDRTIDVQPFDILSLKVEASDVLVFHESGAPAARVHAVMARDAAMGKDVTLRRLSNGAELSIAGRSRSAGQARYEIWIPMNMRVFVQPTNPDRMTQLTVTKLKTGLNGIQIEGQLHTWCTRAVLAHISAKLHGRISCGPYALADSRYTRLRVLLNGTQLADTVETINSSGQAELSFAKLMGITSRPN